MANFNPVQHHIVRSYESMRLCDGQPAGDADISGTDLDALREARSRATLCRDCQQDLGQPAILLRIPRYRNGDQTLAHLYTVPVQYDFDDIRNCPHCRHNPRERNCRAWENARNGVKVLHEEARRIARNIEEMADATGGKPGNLYEFVDDTVAYFTLDAPPWREAEELKGEALERASEILNERGTPGGKAGWPRPNRPVPEPKGLIKARQGQASNHDTRQDGTVEDRARSDGTTGYNVDGLIPGTGTPTGGKP